MQNMQTPKVECSVPEYQSKGKNLPVKSNIIIVSENQIGASVEHPNPSNRDKIIKVLQN